MAWTKKDIEAYVKSWIQHYIDNDSKEITDENWKKENSQWYGSWRFPWWTLWSAISYMSNPNIDLDIAEEYIKISIEANKDWTRYKPSEYKKAIEKLNWNAWRISVRWADNALREQKRRNDSKPKIKKPLWDFVIRFWYRWFIYKLTSRRLSFSWQASDWKRFNTEAQANKRVEKHNITERFAKEDIKVLNINNY
jgi:hypothetical protein